MFNYYYFYCILVCNLTNVTLFGLFLAKFILKGDLDIHARTASKYDDCKLFHLPNLHLW